MALAIKFFKSCTQARSISDRPSTCCSSTLCLQQDIVLGRAHTAASMSSSLSGIASSATMPLVAAVDFARVLGDSKAIV